MERKAAQPQDASGGDPTAAFRELLDRLVPPDAIEVRDVYGGVHRLVTTVSARRQTVLFRAFRSALQRPAVETALAVANAGGVDGLLASVTGDVGQYAGLAAVVGSDEGVVEDLATAFAAAFPEAVGAATRRASEAGQRVESAADLFGVEELLAGLVPLSVRLARRGTSALLALATASGAATAR